MPFELTYATMFNPPEELHQKFEATYQRFQQVLGKEHGMIIGGQERFADEKFKVVSPVNTDVVLGVFQKGTEQDAADAIAAAKAAFPAWSKTPWQERVSLLRKVTDLINERIFELAAAMTYEVGKNRMEALGDAAETAALIRYACDQVESNNGFVFPMGKDPLSGYDATNTSVLRPYGVWLVISPFNFPAALTGGPAGAALVAGNTLVIKPATATPWTTRIFSECLRDAGLPDGVFNYVTGPGSTLGQALVDSPDIDGVTFTGSYEVGMGIYRSFAQGKYVRPIIMEMGGKNPTIVSRHADLDDVVIGLYRSAFGLQGQKCSAGSRIYVEAPLYDELVERLVEMTNKTVIGEPAKREVFLGPVINRKSYEDYQKYVADLIDGGATIATGGKVLTDGDLAKGYFCAPTIAINVPRGHYLWKHEMFLPITFIEKVDSLSEAMELANDIDYGLTAGFYGTEEEARWFFENIEAGVCYANRPQGATTGAWPGYQPFGGWKASGASGKQAGGLNYVQLYMHEQSQTLIRKLI
ncbi:MAG: aldehyde dehydrogenase family protein [Anaerolineaceae bacterium]|nr:aldehyde dehydrogenase family protein [Anaerolineaceae bacterium]